MCRFHNRDHQIHFIIRVPIIRQRHYGQGFLEIIQEETKQRVIEIIEIAAPDRLPRIQQHVSRAVTIPFRQASGAQDVADKAGSWSSGPVISSSPRRYG